MRRFSIAAAVALSVVVADEIAAQDSDWGAVVEKANTHRRYPLRLAAAKKIAAGGDAAIDAVSSFEAEHGADATARTLVDAIADRGSDGEKTVALLERWAFDREFYWRSHAMRGLAMRHGEAHRDEFLAGLDDPSHLMRIESARGLLMLDAAADRVLSVLEDPDPRARLGVALLLLEHGREDGLGEIAGALVRTASFLDDPWGERLARRAARGLIRFANQNGTEGDFGYRSDPQAGIAAMLAWVRGEHPRLVAKPVGESTALAEGGVEVRSCRNGDLFLRWDHDGNVWFGLEALEHVRLDRATWMALREALPDGKGIEGPVVCDFLRVVDADAVDRKMAPGRIGEPWRRWFADFAGALSADGDDALAEALRHRLSQFAPQ